MNIRATIPAVICGVIVLVAIGCSGDASADEPQWPAWLPAYDGPTIDEVAVTELDFEPSRLDPPDGYVAGAVVVTPMGMQTSVERWFIPFERGPDLPTDFISYEESTSDSAQLGGVSSTETIEGREFQFAPSPPSTGRPFGILAARWVEGGRTHFLTAPYQPEYLEQRKQLLAEVASEVVPPD